MALHLHGAPRRVNAVFRFSPWVKVESSKRERDNAVPGWIVGSKRDCAMNSSCHPIRRKYAQPRAGSDRPAHRWVRDHRGNPQANIRVVKARRGRADAQGQRVAIGAVQNGAFSPCASARVCSTALLPVAARSRQAPCQWGRRRTARRSPRPEPACPAIARCPAGQSRGQLLGQLGQVLPLFVRPLLQQTDAGLGNGLEGLLDLRIICPVRDMPSPC